MRFAPALAALVVLAALAGCSPVSTEPEPPPPGRGWAQPAVAIESEEEALAAATRLYTQYVHAAESVTNAGGAAPDRVRPLVTDAYWEERMESYRELQDSGRRTVGRSTITEFRIQAWSEDSITIYVCQDFSEVVVVGPSGVDITPKDRPDIATFEVTLVTSPRLLVSDSKLWSSGSRCF